MDAKSYFLVAAGLMSVLCGVGCFPSPAEGQLGRIGGGGSSPVNGPAAPPSLAAGAQPPLSAVGGPAAGETLKGESSYGYGYAYPYYGYYYPRYYAYGYGYPYYSYYSNYWGWPYYR